MADLVLVARLELYLRKPLGDQTTPWGGMNIIMVGDFMQLPTMILVEYYLNRVALTPIYTGVVGTNTPNRMRRMSPE